MGRFVTGRQDGAFKRLKWLNPYVGIAAAQVVTYTHNRSSSAHTGDKGIR
ncbi:hypothetical protein [Pseudocnuella soli]